MMRGETHRFRSISHHNRDPKIIKTFLDKVVFIIFGDLEEESALIGNFQ